MRNLICIAVFVVSMSFLLCSCTYTPKITLLRVDKDIWVEVGKSIEIEKTIQNESDNKDFTPPLFRRVGDPNITFSYDSSDTSVAAVDQKGIVTALAPGNSVVTVTAAGPDSNASGISNVHCFTYMKDLSMVPDTVDIRLGESLDLSSLTGEFEKWNAIIASNDPSTISVNGTILKAEKPGKVNVVLTLGADTKEIAVSSLQAVTEYHLAKDVMEGVVGSTDTIMIESFLPESANDGLDLNFSSANESIAKVSEDGVVSFLAPGQTTIRTVNSYGLESKCIIRVTEAISGSRPGEGVPSTLSMDMASGELVYYDMYGNKVENNTNSSADGFSGSQGSTNPDDYDKSDPAVKAVLKMVGGKYKCSEVAEAAAQARGKTGWKYTTYKGQDAKVLTPEGFLKIGKIVSEPKTGDILYYADGGAGFSHVAVYIGNGMAVHGNWDLNGKTVIRSAYYTTLTKIVRP